MVDIRKNQRSSGFGRNQATSLAVAGILGAAWVGGTIAGQQKYDPKTGVSPRVATNALAATSTEVTWDLPNLDHERVDFWVERFTTDKRDQFTEFLERSGRYVPMISQKLEERGMPQDLIYLAMIESGFNPTAYSSADASGLWQFIEETGERYGLTVNRVVDERNDPIAATDAALDYLTYLHDRLGSWYLAAAGYNSGENRVARIMREETGSESGTERDYYLIYGRLPREARDYVPLMIAAARISKHPDKYGFADVQIQEPMQFEEVPVDGGTPLAAIAEAANVDLEDVENLNSQFNIGRTPTGKRSLVRIPEGTRTAFMVNWPTVREQRTYAVTKYKIRRGDSLIAIARAHGVSVDAIQAENDLRGSRIVAGRTLNIPSNG